MSNNKLDVHSVVKHLNELLLLDRNAITAIAGYRVVANNDLADSDNIIVGIKPDTGEFHFGVVGMLNGLVEGGRIGAEWEGTTLVGFKAIMCGEV